MKYYITDYITKEEYKKYYEKGIHIYGLRSSEDKMIDTIEKIVVVNNVGYLLTTKKLNFNKNGYIDYEDFRNDNELVDSIEELTKKRIKIKKGRDRYD